MSIGAISSNMEHFSVAQCLQEKNNRLLGHIEDLQGQLNDERRLREGRYADVSTEALHDERFHLLQLLHTLEQRVEWEFQLLDHVHNFSLARFEFVTPTRWKEDVWDRAPPPVPPKLTVEPEEYVRRHDVLLEEMMELKAIVVQSMGDAIRASVVGAQQKQVQEQQQRQLHTTTFLKLRDTVTELRGSLRLAREESKSIAKAFTDVCHDFAKAHRTASECRTLISHHRDRCLELANQNMSLLLERQQGNDVCCCCEKNKNNKIPHNNINGVVKTAVTTTTPTNGKGMILPQR
eukprot:PhM_4_TR9377/c0_g1_i1/m.69087